jgi:limonene-1,2-epoxide hydrolase
MAETDPSAVVRAFCDAVAAGDLDPVVAFFTDDAVYHNIPLDPVVGPAAIRATLEGFTVAVESLEFQILNLSAAGRTVLTERVDVFRFPGGHEIGLPVMGAFDITDDGRISGWRDYFDMNQFMSQLPQG